MEFIKPFKYSNFRNLMSSQLFYQSSVWLGCMILGILVKDIKGNSPFYVGMVGFAYNLPFLFIAPLGGVISDRFSRVNIMRAVCAFFFIPNILLLAFAWNSLPNVWLTLFSALLMGLGFCFAFPAWNAYVAESITDSKVLGRGVSIFAASNRVLQFVAYAAGGFVYAFGGPRLSLLVDIALLIMAFIFLSRLKSTKVNATQSFQKITLIQDFKVGLNYVIRNFHVLAIILMMALSGIVGWTYLFQMPVVNTFYLHGTTITLGYIMGMGGIGGCLGGVAIAMRKGHLHLTRYMLISASILGLSLLSLGFSHHVYQAMLSSFGIDFGLSMLNAISLVFVQQVVPEEIRGRVLSIFVVASFGTIPIGSALYYGGLGTLFGPMAMFVTAGILFFIAVIALWASLTKIRNGAAPVFVEQGLLNNLQQASQI